MNENTEEDHILQEYYNQIRSLISNESLSQNNRTVEISSSSTPSKQSVDQVIVDLVNNFPKNFQYDFQDYNLVPICNKQFQKNEQSVQNCLELTKINPKEKLNPQNNPFIIDNISEDYDSKNEWNVEEISFSELLQEYIQMRQAFRQTALYPCSNQIQQQEDYIYDSESGLFYCPSLDLYYDAETSVYFDKKTNNFYVWNAKLSNWQNVTYQFAAIRSQIESGSEQNGTEHLLLVQLDDSSEETSEFFIVGKNSNLTKLRTPRKTKQTSLVSPQSENIDISNHPSSNVFSFQNNQKQMITRIGRNQKNDIVLDHPLVSNYHAEIIYENVYHQNFFSIRDLGTVNGTFVNEMRLSPAREPSDPVFIRDGDIIRIVHYRFKVKYYEHPTLIGKNDTVQSPPSTSTDNNRVAYKIRTDDLKKVSAEELIAELQSEKTQLKALQNQYKDRAAERRQLHPPLTPLIISSMTSSDGVHMSQKTVSQRTSRKQMNTSLETLVENINSQQPIGNDNIGHQILQKMGWKSGQPLGKQRDDNSQERESLTKPIELKCNVGTRGLGFEQHYPTQNKTI